MKKHLVDLHIHSNFSDGKLNVAEIVDYYGRKNFSAIAITDHLADTKTLTGLVTHQLKLSLSQQNIDAYLQTIHTEARRAREKYNMLLIPGVEVTLNSWSRKSGAHVVFLGIDRYINPNRSVEDLLTDHSEFFSIAAHPLWNESYEFKTTYLWENRHHLHTLFDAWECATAQRFAKEVYTSGYNYVSSSDFHHPNRFESWKTQTYLDDLCYENIFYNIRNKLVEPVWI
jgi:PHP family Zn ribbon phosphoesterase